MKAKYFCGLMSLLNVICVGINLPGAFEGKVIHIFGAIICAVCLGFTLSLTTTAVREDY